MGNTPSSPVQKCVESALCGKNDRVAFKNTPFYQLAHVRPYNLGNPVTPVAITYPETSQQIAAIVNGGHSYANYGLGGGQEHTIVLDVKHFKQFSMDKATWQATIGSGTLLGDVTKQLHKNGKRAMAHGTCPQVGIGGHAKIGGLGPSSRLWGSALDHVEEVEVVLANSSIIRASATQNQDVLFAIKGSAAGFGIVTELKMRTQAEPEEAVLYSYNFHGGSSQEKAEVFKQKFASQFILTEQFGAIVTGTFFGSQKEYDSLNISARLPSKDENVVVLKDWLGVVGHWAEDIALEIVGGIQSNFYAKSIAYTDEDVIPDDGVDELFQYIDRAHKGGALWFIIWDLEGGAINDVPTNATAYGHRDALFYHQAYAVNLLGKINDKTRIFLAGVNKVVQTALQKDDLGAYAGYVDPALKEGDASAKLYWGSNVARVQDIKSQIDPLDVFSNPQSIRPAKRLVRAQAAV
ncbi:Glucooligosaccharide oxidase [Plenodomus tracheiphilus IPT5]|uniref:Glucooligosaccharide oxidase n=1 Tax=Plenodomus tracheiphilus IPT5 TaxID=1408161 RepID=A0A6A7BMN0_9PLEO|nr:Glucooligosaccharide oxidase [Plenodomus tracheiphilus IPT5]